MATIQEQLAIARAVTAPTISVSSGNLFQIASQYLGDATQWNRIAELNGLTDPWIAPGVVVTLRLPAKDASQGNGGVLGI